MDKKIDLSIIKKITNKVGNQIRQLRRKLPEIPPDTFEHQRQVNEEFATMEFKNIKIKLFPEDEAKLKTMSREEKTEFMQKIREEHRYTVVKDDISENK